MIKNGQQHIESLRDGRELLFLGKCVPDVTTHPGFRNAVATVGSLYDYQAAPENVEKMTFQPPGGAGRVNRCWQLPSNFEDLKRRREALTSWAEIHCGFLGRSPDHVASSISGMVMGIEQFTAFDPARAGALQDYYTYARDRDLYLTYVIINPQADRSKSPNDQADPFCTLRLCDRDERGITVKGAKMLGTAAILSNEVFVTSIQPLRPGDEPYALSFCVPMNIKGLKILSRKSYEFEAGSVFDNPLSSRWDENDAVLYFDEVTIPWERVFVCGDLAMCQKQFHATPAHVYQNYQGQIRLMVKLRFLVGLAKRIAEANAIDSFPQVRETLGEMAAEAAMVEGLVYAMEAKGCQWNQYFIPDKHLLYSAQVVTQKLYPKVIHTLRTLAGGGMIMLPSSVEDFRDPVVASYNLRAQVSPTLFEPAERVKLFKLAWDAVGSEFASRHIQYEMFYAGAEFVVKGHSMRTYAWSSATDLVDRVLGSYDLESELRKPAATVDGPLGSEHADSKRA